MTLWIGIGRADATPPVGAPLGGYPGGHRVCGGAHDELEILAVAVRNDVSGSHVVLVCFDGILVPPGLVSGIDVGPDIDVIAVSSHTHAAASLETWDQGVIGPYSQDVQERLFAACRRASFDAVNSEQPGHLMVGTGRLAEPVGTNRRDPQGRRDEIVRIVEAHRSDDTPLAILVIHGCHPTVLSAENTLASADLGWGLRARLATALPDVPIAYLPGGAGDQSTRHTRRGSTFAEAARLGGLLGDAVLEARSALNRVDTSRIDRATFTLRTRSLPPLDVARQQWEDWSEETERRRVNGASPSHCRQAEVELIGASHDLRRAEAGLQLPDELEVSITRWDLGDIAIAFWPVEPTIDLALKLECDDRTWLCGYASGYLGYLLAEADCQRSGYEVAASVFDCAAAEHFVEITRSLARKFDT